MTYPPLASHQSIVNFLGVSWENDEEVGSDQSMHPSIVIEQVELGSLSEFLLTTRGPDKKILEYEVKRSLGMCIAFGLDALHECRIVRGDIKPGNVLFFTDQICRARFEQS